MQTIKYQAKQRFSMDKGFNFVYERKRVNMRVFRRIFFPNYVNIDGKTHKIFVDTKGQKEINYDDPSEYNLDSPFQQVALYRLAQASNSTECVLEKSGVLNCKVYIGTSEEVSGKQVDGVNWLPFNPDRLMPLEERKRKLREQIAWEKQLTDTD